MYTLNVFLKCGFRLVLDHVEGFSAVKGGFQINQTAEADEVLAFVDADDISAVTVEEPWKEEESDDDARSDEDGESIQPDPRPLDLAYAELEPAAGLDLAREG